jgi:hypothetical protein
VKEEGRDGNSKKKCYKSERQMIYGIEKWMLHNEEFLTYFPSGYV